MAKEPLYIEIYNTIKEWIAQGKYAYGELLPTEQELCKQFFVSRITIQKCMRKLSDEGLIKRISGRGTYVDIQNDNRDSKTAQRKIGVILCNIGGSFGLDLFVAIEEAASKAGFAIIFKNSHDNVELEKAAVTELVACGVSGLIIQPIHGKYYNEQLIKLHLQKFPVILVDRQLAGFSIPSVSTNNYEATVSALEFLFKNGHESIAFICFAPKHTSTTEDRLSGFKAAFLMHDMLLTSDSIFTDIVSPAETRADTWREDVDKLKSYLAGKQGLTCLFASEYSVARLVYAAVGELGKKIPDDYSFIMFDSAESLEMLNVSHIRQDQVRIGRVAVDLLLKLLKGEITSDRIYVPYSLVEGATVKNIADGL